MSDPEEPEQAEEPQETAQEEESKYLDDMEKVPELEDDQGFGGNPPQTYPGKDLEEEEDEPPIVGWDEGRVDG